MVLPSPRNSSPRSAGAETRRRRFTRTLSLPRRFFFRAGEVCGPALQTELPDPLLKSFAKRHHHGKTELTGMARPQRHYDLRSRFVLSTRARTRLSVLSNRAMS